MGNLIDARYIINRITEERRRWGDDYDVEQVLGDIEDAPTIDAVELVRCKDCKFASYEPYKDFINVYICNYSQWTRSEGGRYPDWYCARAERRTDAEKL